MIYPENLLDNLSEDDIRNRLERLQPVAIPMEPADGSYRKAAVLMPLIRIEDEWHLLFIRRTNTVQDHKGQVAFPGGSWEKTDLSLELTALRETHEEIGLASQNVNVLGKLGSMLTVTHYLVSAFVGVIPSCVTLTPEPEEVSRIFTIPLHWLADSTNREERDHFYQTWRRVIYFQAYDGEVLWGASAALTVRLIEALIL